MTRLSPIWDEPPQQEIPDTLLLAVDGDRLVAQVLARRHLVEPAAASAFIDYELYIPSQPQALPGIELAVDRLQYAVHRQEKICVWGDFDVDGQTSTTLLYSTLRKLGADVVYHIPVRAVESHGVNLPVLSQILDGGVQLVVTCDTGISAHDAVEVAHQRGVDFIITDHHDLPVSDETGAPHLPEALAVINPKQLQPGHPLAALPGVGVAYKLAEALYQSAGFNAAELQHLDLVALGIIADLAIQQGDVRYLLQRGLGLLRQNQRPGLQVMLELAGLDPANLTEEHVGYVLAPRLNALGRLGDANPAVELLTTTDKDRAYLLAQEIEVLNARRKLLTDQVFQAAQAAIEQDPALLDSPVLVLSHPAWPAGVIGIVANRLVEYYYRPAILISTPPGENGRGSARSIVGVNITAALAENATQLLQFGGHPMAAGLSIRSDKIPEFRRALGKTVARMIGVIKPAAHLLIDAYIPLAGLNLDLVASLERLAPFGPGNPPVILASRNLRLLESSPVGQNEEHLLMTVADETGAQQRVVWWQGVGWPQPDGLFDLAYSVRSSSYRSRREVQIAWKDARPAAQESIPSLAQKTPVQVVDLRSSAHPFLALQRVQAQELVQVWREAGAVDRLPGKDRYELMVCRALAIWTTPPGWAELQAALDAASPEVVYLFAVDPRMDEPHAFLKRLFGLVKYVISTNQGAVSLQALSAATAQREAAVKAGLNWLQARGSMRIMDKTETELVLAAGEPVPGADTTQAARRLQLLLDEARAYRAYFRQASPGSLLNLIHD